MPLRTIHGYTKHVNGKLVTVRGYDQANGRARGIPQSKPYGLAAEPGAFPANSSTIRNAEYTHGLSPHAVFPAGRYTRKPIIKWTRHSVALSEVFLSSSAGDGWTEAVQEAIDHILLVIRNNPKKSMDEILARKDVQEALRAAGDLGATTVINNLSTQWGDASAPEDSPYLERVLSDMTRNGASFANRMTEALASGDSSQAQKILLKDRLRVVAAESVVQTRSAAEAALYRMKKAGVKNIKWQARLLPGTNLFAPNVCSSCKALHGKVVKIGDSFDVSILTQNGLTPYGKFIAPPAHPFCGCQVVPA